MRRNIAQWLVIATISTACAGCILSEGSQRVPPLEDDREESGLCVVAATSGTDGGNGGLLAVTTQSGVALDGAVDVTGGPAGSAGAFADGPASAPGNPGEAGLADFSTDADWQFDATDITPGSLISVGVGGIENTLTVGGSETEPALMVERLELGPGATLVISRYPVIVAETIVIGEGARLLLRDTGTASMTIVDPASEGGSIGAAGSSVRIIARDIVVEGSLDASGAPGRNGAQGHHGGHLRIEAETLSLGALGSISLAGGAGSNGSDEQDCSTAAN